MEFEYVTSYPDGENYVAQWDEQGNMTAICGPLNYREVTQSNLDTNSWEWYSVKSDEEAFPKGYGIQESPYKGDIAAVDDAENESTFNTGY